MKHSVICYDEKILQYIIEEFVGKASECLKNFTPVLYFKSARGHKIHSSDLY